MERILVIDDDMELCSLLEEYLTPEGFLTTAENNGEKGLATAKKGQHDLVILDVMLPGMSGFDVLHSLREWSSVPVIMLTARGEDVDRVVGLEMGADDYMPKPFLPRELVARIRAVLRRSRRESPLAGTHRTLCVGDVEIDTGARVAKVSGKSTRLTDAEFVILEKLLAEAGGVVSREQLSLAALGRESGPEDRSLDVHISNLRRKLGKTIDGIPRIKAVRGAGYLYTLPLRADALS
ncbi:two-component response transcriptional regulator OmpR family [Desulfovibrio ferrophilus]|uniref:Two-component response transcriptional regulator OmpR family n=2 Tax=Desulfovibrio ferrophilus TaxID=241368 RepID=A0A2Z6AWT4_9BACT|nr:two-component response transcriptional regulator OmpR family [Desulfovibrio ferrophilus]